MSTRNIWGRHWPNTLGDEVARKRLASLAHDSEIADRTGNRSIIVRETSDALTPSLSRRQALIGLYALQAWERVGKTKYGGTYAPRWFHNQRSGFLTGLAKEDRKGILAQIREWTCTLCGERLPENSTGDHLIALAVGGRQGVLNFLALCPRHNAGKGKRDLVHWWMTKGFPLEPLLPHPLCSYCRQNWQFLPAMLLDEPAPNYLLMLLERLAQRLPTDEHRTALYITCGQVDGDV